MHGVKKVYLTLFLHVARQCHPNISVNQNLKMIGATQRLSSFPGQTLCISCTNVAPLLTNTTRLARAYWHSKRDGSREIVGTIVCWQSGLFVDVLGGAAQARLKQCTASYDNNLLYVDFDDPKLWLANGGDQVSCFMLLRAPKVSDPEGPKIPKTQRLFLLGPYGKTRKDFVLLPKCMSGTNSRRNTLVVTQLSVRALLYNRCEILRLNYRPR